MARATFLIGCHRAGTTLARYLLDGHPNLASPPESKFIAAMHAFYCYPQALPALASLGVTSIAVRRELRRLIETVMDGHARGQGKRRWVDKTPNYYRILPFIHEIFGGEAQYLFLARHPLDCAHSLSAFYDGREVIADPEIARSIAARGRGLPAWSGYWAEVYALLLEFHDKHADRCYLFKYEDLVQDTASTLKSVLTFLEEDVPAGLADTALKTVHTRGYEDPGIRGTAAVLSDRVGRWRSWRCEDVEACWSVASPVASRLGYAVI